MQKIPTSVTGLTALLLHVIAMPIFFLGFILLYRSNWMLDFIGQAEGSRLVFNTLMLTCILIGVLCASRIPMTATRVRLSWLQYTIWAGCEWLVCACFMALYMALVYGDYGYFPALGQCMLLVFSTLAYPYLLVPALMCAARPDATEEKEENLIRFADSTGRLKLVVANTVLLYIEGKENYIHIHYMDGAHVKMYALRQSMIGVEELLGKHGIVRCQRSYFVNPRHVKVLRRDKEGFIHAELDVTDVASVPVSPKYYDQLSKML
jgi:hypothetical protein